MLYTLLLSLLPLFPQPDACYTQCGDNTACLCDCLYRQAQSQRAAESYAEAVKTYRAVDALCPDKGAAAAIDSIYQTHRIWIFQDGAFAVATPLGEPLSAFEYYNPQPFKNGIGVCEDNSGRYFFVDVNGKRLNDLPGYEGIIAAEGGLYVVKKPRLAFYNYCVISGKNVKPVFKIYDSFPNKLSEFGDSLRSSEWVSFIEHIAQFDEASSFFEGVARVRKADKWGYINKEGKFLIEPQFGIARDFSEGVARVTKDGKWGHINKEGKFLIEPQFEEVIEFSEGVARVRKEGKWGYINKAGNILMEPQFDEASYFSEGVARVQKAGKWGYINKEGKMLVEPQFDNAYPFSKGVEQVMKDTEQGLVTKSGLVVPPILDNYHWAAKGIIALYANGRRGLLFVEEETYIPCEYEEIAQGSDAENWVIVKKNGQWGWVDHSGKTKIPCRYDAVTPFDVEGKAWVFQFGERFRINRKGEMVWER